MLVEPEGVKDDDQLAVQRGFRCRICATVSRRGGACRRLCQSGGQAVLSATRTRLSFSGRCYPTEFAERQGTVDLYLLLLRYGGGAVLSGAFTSRGCRQNSNTAWTPPPLGTNSGWRAVRRMCSASWAVKSAIKGACSGLSARFLISSGS